MLAKILVERTTQKNRRTCRAVRIVITLVSLIESVPIVDSMQDVPSSMFKQSNPPLADNPITRIGVDILGCDMPAKDLLRTVIAACDDLGEKAHFVVFCRPEHFTENIPANLTLVPVEEEIFMDDLPLKAIRKKKNSSLCQGIRFLKEKRIDAFISAGNTGALLACSATTLKKLPGIARPALLTVIPCKNKEVAVLDVGATTICKKSHLLQFAMMGIAYQRSRGILQPTVGLLNIGSEAQKGTPEHIKTYEALAELSRNFSYPMFQGNKEGRDVFDGTVDVLVTDGFTGNIFLKTAEGIASFIFKELQEKVNSPEISSLLQRFDYAEYAGALLCGIEGIVIKCHGLSQPKTFKQSFLSAIHLKEHSFLEKISKQHFF